MRYFTSTDLHNFKNGRRNLKKVFYVDKLTPDDVNKMQQAIPCTLVSHTDNQRAEILSWYTYYIRYFSKRRNKAKTKNTSDN